eukprot:TRINITY_DN6680_c1_g1_i1.p1 TRINITY_DN6680_c1_g1~~TRINITY_DN6680_c1_g1_i1.p1  ORF type:complete len:663 (-),score=223.34 TRINITY_DN6680_c1_g1_i1:50-1936(-)
MASGRMPLGNLNNNTLNDNRKSLAGKGPQRMSIQAPPSSVRKSTGFSRISVAPVGRPSTTNQTRPSMTNQPGHGVRNLARQSVSFPRKADPRNLSDKAFKEQCIRSIINYLITHNFGSITFKSLMNPTKNDFTAILQFLFQKVDPFFIIKDLETDVPHIFKVVKYPVALPKSALQSVGTPHTWPALLGALGWFVELLNFQEANNVSGVGPNGEIDFSILFGGDSLEDSDTQVKRLLFEYCSSSYIDWMSGKDDFAPLEEVLGSQFDQGNAIIRSDIERLESSKSKMVQEITHLQQTEGEVARLEETRERMEADKRKFLGMIQKRKTNNNLREESLRDLTTEYQSFVLEHAEVEKERDHYQNLVNGQAAIAVELERQLSERNYLDEQIASLLAKKENQEKANNAIETSTSKRLEDLEKVVQEFNAKGRKMQLIPTNAKYAQGKDYQVVFKIQKQEEVLEQWKSHIKPSLMNFKSEQNRSFETKKGEHLSLTDQIERLEESISVHLDSISRLEEEIRTTEAQYETDKEKLKDFVNSRQVEISSAVQDIKSIQDSIADSLSKSQFSLTQQNEEYENTKKMCEAEMKEVYDLLVKSLESLGQHKSYFSENLKGLQEHALGMNEKAVKSGLKL